MMYNEKFVATVKVNGKVLREQGDKVFAPWNSEYSVYLKNLNSQRALVNVEIDGECVTGSGLILDQNQGFDLERFLDGDLNKGRRFKFIKRTNDIEDFRGVRPEDGLIRVEYQFEEHQPYYHPPYRPPYTPQFGQPWRDDDWYGHAMDVYGHHARGVVTTTCDSTMVQNQTATQTSCYNSTVDPGITVKGSESSQSFVYGSIGKLDLSKYSIVMQIIGIDATKPVTVKTRKQCPSCGRSYKYNATYCSHDGTFLELSCH